MKNEQYIEYTVGEVGGDPEFGEPPFTVFHTAMPSHDQFEEVQFDYDTAESEDYLEDVMLRVLPMVAQEADRLHLGHPYVVFAYLGDDDHVARFVDGTDGHRPVILIDPGPMREFRDPTRFVEDSLVHELGHAYLRSRGIEYFGYEEEDLVEAYALTRDRSLITDL